MTPRSPDRQPHVESRPEHPLLPGMLRRLGTAIAEIRQRIFGSGSQPRRSLATPLSGWMILEDRTMMSATPFIPHDFDYATAARYDTRPLTATEQPIVSNLVAQTPGDLVALHALRNAERMERNALNALPANDPARAGIESNLVSIRADWQRIFDHFYSLADQLDEYGVIFSDKNGVMSGTTTPELPPEIASAVALQQRVTQLRRQLAAVETAVTEFSSEFARVTGLLNAQQQTVNTAKSAMMQRRHELLSLRLNQILSVLSTGHVAEHAAIAFGGGITARAHTGWQRHGTTVKDGVLVSIGAVSGSGGTVNSPIATDHIVVVFDALQSGITRIDMHGTCAVMRVNIETATGMQTLTGGGSWSVSWNGSAIRSISVVNQSGSGTVGLRSLVRSTTSTAAIEAEVDADPSVAALRATLTTEQGKLAALQTQATAIDTTKTDLERMRSDLAGQLMTGLREATASAPDTVQVTPLFQVLPGGGGTAVINYGHLPMGLTVRVVTGQTTPRELVRLTTLNGSGQHRLNLTALGFTGNTFVQLIDATGRVHSDINVYVNCAQQSIAPYMGGGVGNWGRVTSLAYHLPEGQRADPTPAYGYVEVASYASLIESFRSNAADLLMPASLRGSATDIARIIDPQYDTRSQTIQYDLRTVATQARSEVWQALAYFGTRTFQDQLKAKLGMQNPTPWTGEITSNASSARSTGLLPSGQSVRSWVAAQFDAIYKIAQQVAGDEAIYVQQLMNEQKAAWAEIDRRKLELEAMDYSQLPAEYRGGGMTLDRWKLLQQSGGMSAAGAALSRTEQRVLNTLQHSQDPRMVRYRQLTGIDTGEEALLYVQGIPVNGYSANRDGIGGAPADPTNRQLNYADFLAKARIGNDPNALTAAQALSHSTPRIVYSQLSASLPLGQRTLTTLELPQQTIAGRVLQNGSELLWRHRGNAYAQWFTALQLQVVTDIPAHKFMSLATSGTADQFASAMKALINEAQYGHLLTSIPTENISIVAATPQLPEGAVYSDQVRIRLDVLTGITNIRRVAIWSNGREVSATGAATFISIPISQLQSVGTAGPSTDPLDLLAPKQPLTLKIILDTGDVLTHALAPVRVLRTTNPRLQLSTNTDATRRNYENEVLSDIAKYFPVQNASSWQWNIASSFHTSSAFHAIDLNLPGLTDAGQEVRSSAAGIVRKINTNFGTIEIEHRTASGRVWTTRFLHAPVRQFTNPDGSVVDNKFFIVKETQSSQAGSRVFNRESERIVYEFDSSTHSYISWIERQNASGAWQMVGEQRNTLNANDLYAYVGSQGANGNAAAFFPHGHWEFLDENRQSIDMRKLLLDVAKITNVVAEDAGLDGSQVNFDDNTGLAVSWNSELNAFVSTANKLILSRSPDSPQQYWIAWHEDPTQRKSVVWKKMKFIDDTGNLVEKETWIMLENSNYRWNGTSFIKRLP